MVISYLEADLFYGGAIIEKVIYIFDMRSNPSFMLRWILFWKNEVYQNKK